LSDGSNPDFYKQGSRRHLSQTDLLQDARRLDVEAPCLERAEQLLDDPALAIEGDNPAGIGNIGDLWLVNRRQ
jgi:hypothetical protein